MKYLLLLSGENLELAKEEATSLADSRKFKQRGNLLILESKSFEFKRLAYTHKVFRFLFSCKEKEFVKKIKNIDWQKHYKKSFSVKSHNLNIGAGKIADIIWAKIKKPKVNLKNAATGIEFFRTDNEIYCGLLLWENKGNFNRRKAHKRPGFSPVSLHPKLARCLVNLSKAKTTLVDPFCGTGGILIEAGLMNLKPIGSDIDKNMLKKAENNLKFFKIKGYKLLNKDATKLKIKADAIATDPPYGQASSLKKQKLRILLENFLKNIYNNLKEGGHLVIILPNNLRIKSKFKIKKRIGFYIHKNLTRTINIMSKTKAGTCR